MKKVIAFLTFAFVLLVSPTSTAKLTVQQSLDTQIFVTSNKGILETSVTLPKRLKSESFIVRELNYEPTSYNSDYIAYHTVKATGNNYKHIVNTYKHFAPNKDVIWLTNMKSK